MSSNMILRIDDRLVHGQVITGWVKSLNLNNIIVANNKLIKDEYKISATKIAIPTGVDIEFLTIAKTAKALNENKWEKKQTIILVESPKDAYEILKRAPVFKTVNVGGLHLRNHRFQLTDNIAIDTEDEKYLLMIHNLGITLEGRALPTDEPYNVIEVLSEYMKKNYGINRNSKI